MAKRRNKRNRFNLLRKYRTPRAQRPLIFKEAHFPTEARAILTYNDRVAIDSGTAHLGYYEVNLNAINDCQASTTSAITNVATEQQPAGHDILEQYYDRYRVYACKIEVETINQRQPVTIPATLTDGTSSKTTSALGTTLWHGFHYNDPEVATSAPSNYVGFKVDSRFSGHRLIGAQKIANTRYFWTERSMKPEFREANEAQMGSGDQQIHKCKIFWGTVDQTTDLKAVAFIKITYYVELNANKYDGLDFHDA